MTTLEVKYTVDMWSEFQEFDWWLLNRGPLDSGFTVIGQSKLTLLQWTRKLLSLKTNQAYESTARVCHSFDSQQHRFRSLTDVCLAYFGSEISSLICFLLAGRTLDSCCASFQTEKSSDQGIWISFCFTTRPRFICVVHSQCRYEGMSLVEL